MNKILWSPNPSNISKSKMAAFMQFVNQKYGYSFRDYSDLYKWSVSEIGLFWESVALFASSVSNSDIYLFLSDIILEI